MKILAIGDFHGEFPEKLIKRIKKEQIDLILSPGDYCGNKELGKLFFKYLYGKDEEEVPKNVLKRISALEKTSLGSGIRILKDLNNLKKLFCGVRGNWDPIPWEYDLGVDDNNQYEFGLKRFNKSLGNLELIDFKLKKFQGIEIIGGTSSTSPGFIKKDKLKKLKKILGKEEAEEYIRRWKKHYNKRKKKYEKLFRRAKGFKIFLTHNCPNNTKLDKIKRGPQKGKHYGSWLERKLIDKYQPSLVICGHMHENQGMQLVWQSLVINTGAAHEGKAAIIEISENKKIKSVRFIR